MTAAYRHSMRGFTLIEMLAVIVIATLVATAATVSIASADRGAQLLQVTAGIRELDARARLQARSSGSAVQILLHSEHNELVLLASTGERLGSWPFPGDLQISLESTSQIPRIVFDRQGHSEDYMVVIETDATRTTWRVSGLSGFIERKENAS